MEYSTGMKLSSTAELQKTLIDAAEIIAVFISMVKSDEKPHESLHVAGDKPVEELKRWNAALKDEVG
jgi:hypothetical protein